MIRSIGSAKLSTYSQTLNGLEILDALLDKLIESYDLVGQFW